MSGAPTPASAEQQIDSAADGVRGMSQDLADELAPSVTLLNRIAAATRKAPLQSLAIAFFFGIIFARRR